MYYLKETNAMLDFVTPKVATRLKTLQELDFEFRRASEQLETSTEAFFRSKQSGSGRAGTTTTGLKSDAEVEMIRAMQSEALNLADKKVDIADEMYNLVYKCSRALDNKIAQCKAHLEANNEGSTKAIEQKVYRNQAKEEERKNQRMTELLEMYDGPPTLRRADDPFASSSDESDQGVSSWSSFPPLLPWMPSLELYNECSDQGTAVGSSSGMPGLEEQKTLSESEDATGLEQSMAVSDDDQIYCFCRKGSFGQMIACDYGKCPFEWFHFNCVELVEAPNGEWFCSAVCAKLAKQEEEERMEKRKRMRKSMNFQAFMDY